MTTEGSPPHAPKGPRTTEDGPSTRFAPAERLPDEAVREQSAYLRGQCNIRILETVPSAVMILNSCRQIIYANRTLLGMLKAKSQADLLGLRPGELFQCSHAFEEAGGCGTAEACRHCEAVRTILGATSEEPTEHEARILTGMGGRFNSMNLQVSASVMEFGEMVFTVVYLRDISAQKMHELLAQAFFHDQMNALSGIIGVSRLMCEETKGEMRELAGAILSRAEHMAREVAGQRLLTAAEKGHVILKAEALDPYELLADLVRLFNAHDLAHGKKVVLERSGPGALIRTDRTILYRVIENLIKNALEASPAGETVNVGHVADADTVSFYVNNRGYMEPAVRHQIFQRAFSTKGKGRGLGTYSVKILTENALGGRVDFDSDPVRGTTFRITLPRDPEA